MPIFLLLLVGWTAYTDDTTISLMVLGLALLTLLPFMPEPAKWLGWSFTMSARPLP